MSSAVTQSDLERTDVLPQLDVAAYETARTQQQDAPDTSSTALLATLRDAEAEEREEEARVGAQSSAAQPALVSLLERIDRLEGELVTTRSDHTELKRRYEELTRNHEALRQRFTQTLAENERLSEQGAAAKARVQAQDERGQQEAVVLRRRIAELENEHRTQVARLERERSELHTRIAGLTANIESTRAEQLPLQQSVQRYVEALTERDRSIASLRTSLHEQERAASHLARMLAGRMSDDQFRDAGKDRHEAAVKELQQANAALRSELNEAQQNVTRHARELATTSQVLADAVTLHDQLQRAVSDRDAQLISMRRELELARNERDARTPGADAAENVRASVEKLEAQTQAQATEIASLQRLLQERLNQAGALELRVEELEEQNTALATELKTARAAPVAASRSAGSVGETLEVEISAVVPHVVQPNPEALALELAATRVEVQRQAREQQELERAIRVRDELLHTLRGELQTAQEERGILALQLQKGRARLNEMAERLLEKDARIAALRAGAPAAAVPPAQDELPAGNAQTQRLLEPINHEGPVIVLDRKVMTVGRTDESDVCVPSKLVSRNHARLLVGMHSVTVIDSGSTNGCYVNDREVKKEVAHDGDVIRFGDYAYRLTLQPRGNPPPKDYSETPVSTATKPTTREA